MRFTPSPIHPFTQPHPRFVHSMIASAINGSPGKMFPKYLPELTAPIFKTIVCKIDPKKVRRGHVPNRLEETFFNADFENLCESIQRSQGNVSPIRVRRTKPNADEFILIYGERRLRACEAVKVEVLAIIESDVDSASEIMLMIRENLCRVDLSPIELGQQAKYAVENKVVPSLRAFAREVGRSTSSITESVKLAELPTAILNALPDPKQLQFRDAKPLTEAVKSNPSAVLSEVEKIKAEVDIPSTRKMVSRIIEAGGNSVPPVKDTSQTVLKCFGERFGQILFDDAGKVEITFDKPIDDKYRPALEKQIVDFYVKNIVRIGLKPRINS